MCCLLHHNAGWQGSDLAAVKIEEGVVSTQLMMVSGICFSNNAAVTLSTSQALMDRK